ncbi:hypothetical protein GO738_07770 [Gordonibacter sp. ResAG-59]|uniref:Uncharacterized protein n=1 Tax=Gordonibacter urolithinfaciens TaxID=1335613 RepID=A0A6N8IKB5_9ACTN|nr:hypothetical protein [Gordonibacter urolithinfaciens]MVN38127.1 hypothetical protein [Gordonibacter urolithinfaciens]MVN55353.1 hypothetical protein [Gordonibacter urolithinfaciens]MVN60487.1 hypothetical protein [Gordonibacter urolithinfaciens]
MTAPPVDRLRRWTSVCHKNSCREVRFGDRRKTLSEEASMVTSPVLNMRTRCAWPGRRR